MDPQRKILKYVSPLITWKAKKAGMSKVGRAKKNSSHNKLDLNEKIKSVEVEDRFLASLDPAALPSFAW